MPFLAPLIGLVGPKLSTVGGLLKNYWFAYKWVIIIAILVAFGLYCVRFGYKMSENEHAAAVSQVLIERDKLQKKVIEDEDKHRMAVINIQKERKIESTSLKKKLSIAIQEASKNNNVDCNLSQNELNAINENIDAANRAIPGD